MSNVTLGLPNELHAYVLEHGVREPEILARLREETARLPQHDMQIAPEQGAFMALLVRLMGARRCLEVGTFTGYSSLAVALALPEDGRIVCCDISTEWTETARRYWTDAGVADRVDLRIAPALETLDALINDPEHGDDSFDFAFLDADKRNYPAYYERLVYLVRPGGLIAIDNVFWEGEVAQPPSPDDDEDVRAVRQLNDTVADDPRVDVAMVPVADGLTLARVR
jgi:predicted O-methyltransferase YrrM